MCSLIFGDMEMVRGLELDSVPFLEDGKQEHFKLMLTCGVL